MELTAMFKKEERIAIRVPFAQPDLGQKERKYLLEAYDSTYISGKGSFIDRFEEKFAKFIGVKHAITCSSGTAALNLAYHACGMNGNSQVIVPNNTFVATKNMVRLFTNNIFEAFCDPDTFNIQLDKVKADYVIGVHLYGNPVDMGSVYKNKFIFIEDCAQSLGSKFKGKMCGSYGMASTFSFHSAKMITTGEGGMVCTDEDVIADRVRHLKNQSMIKPYEHDMIGYNFRMTNLQAAIGLAQLERIKEFIEKKDWIEKYYNSHLNEKFIRQKDTRNSKVVRWANAYTLSSGSEELRSKLLMDGIETRPGFVGSNTIVFPCSTTLTEGDLAYVCEAANKHTN